MKKLFIALIILPFLALAEADETIESLSFENGITAARICYARMSFIDRIFQVKPYIGTSKDKEAKKIINMVREYIDSDTVDNAILYDGDEKELLDKDFDDCTERALEKVRIR